MKALARSYVWWPGLDEDITGVVKGCAECQSVSLGTRSPLGMAHVSMGTSPCRFPWSFPRTDVFLSD